MWPNPIPIWIGSEVLGGGGGSDSPSFSPSSRAELHTWFKADTGTFEDAAMSTVAADDGDTVLGFSDQSGNGHHATKASAPGLVLKLNQYNGLPCLRGDGSALYLRTGNFSAALGARTIYLLAKSDGQAFDYFYDGNSAATESSLSTNTGFNGWILDAGTPQIGGTPAAALSVFTATIPAAGNSQLRVNGTQVIDAACGNDEILQFVLMARNDNAANMDGDFVEMVVMSGVDSAEQITQMETYLATRGGVTF